MSKTKQILILAIIVAVGAAVGLITINSFSVASVQANQGGRSGSQKWEYCTITDTYWLGSFGDRPVRPVVVIRYFQVGGAKDETVEFVQDVGKKADIKDAWGKAIAKLGDEGWEMVLKEPNSGHAFYFKRPKQ